MLWLIGKSFYKKCCYLFCQKWSMAKVPKNEQILLFQCKTVVYSDTQTQIHSVHYMYTDYYFWTHICFHI